MNRRARSGALGEARIRELGDVKRLHHLGPSEKVHYHPASMQNIMEVRLWDLMQDCLFNPRAHKNIKPLQMPDNLQELCPPEDKMLDDEDLKTTLWPESTGSQRVKDEYVSSEATMEDLMDDAAGDDLVPRFDCLKEELSGEMILDNDLIPSFDRLDDEPSSETMLDDDLISSFDRLADDRCGEMMLDDEVFESGSLSSEGSFEDLMAVPVDSQGRASASNDIAAASRWELGEALVNEQSYGSHGLTSRADSEEGLDEASSMPDSEEILDSSFSTVENTALSPSNAFDEEQPCSGRFRWEDKDDLLDP